MLEGDPNPNGVVMKTSLIIIAAALEAQDILGKRQAQWQGK